MMKKLLLPLLILLLVGLLAFPASAASGYMLDVEISGTYDYAKAHEVLELVNQKRTESGLAPLTLDATLTELAMQRAMECGVYYSHTRPDNSDYTTIFEAYPAYSAAAECIAVGQKTAADAAEYWATSTDDSDRLMNAANTAVGIGCFYQEGATFWVLLLHNTVADSSPVPAEAVEKKDIPLQVYSEYIDFRCEQVPLCTAKLYANNTIQPIFFLVNQGFHDDWGTTISGGYTLESSNESVISCSDKTITAISEGYAVVRAIFGDQHFDFDFFCDAPLVLTVDDYMLHVDPIPSKCGSPYWFRCYFKREGGGTSERAKYWTLMNFDGFADYSLDSTMRYLETVEPGIYTFVFRAYDEHIGWMEGSNRVYVATPGYFGDTDGNRNIDFFDAMLVLQYVTGLVDETALDTKAADVDGSGAIDVFDGMYILQYFAGLIEKLPA